MPKRTRSFREKRSREWTVFDDFANKKPRISRSKLLPCASWRSENFSEIETESGKNRITVEGGRLFDLLRQAARPIDCCTIPLRIEQPPELRAIRHELFHLLFDLRQAIRL